jgi:hypothetical protein
MNRDRHCQEWKAFRSQYVSVHHRITPKERKKKERERESKTEGGGKKRKFIKKHKHFVYTVSQCLNLNAAFKELLSY